MRMPLASSVQVSTLSTDSVCSVRTHYVPVQATLVAGASDAHLVWNNPEVGMSMSEDCGIADGIAVKRPGGLTLPIIRELVDEIVEVSEDEIARAIAHCVQRGRIVVEGAGAAGVAALLSGKVAVEPSDTVCTILCGGNIDGNLLSRVIEQVMVRQGRYLLLRLSVLDRSGSLAPLVGCVAEAGANIVDVFHRRAVWLAPLGKVGLELVLEVRDDEHADQVIEHLQNAGYHAEREPQGLWPE